MLTKEELKGIADIVSPNFNEIKDRYDEIKYRPEIYEHAKLRFSTLDVTPAIIEEALRWKYGKLNQTNYPKTLKDTIQASIREWPEFLKVYGKVPAYPEGDAEATFSYWFISLVFPTRYITMAFLTHLIHPEKYSIIDQHNFRSMNHLIKSVRPMHKFNVKPSTSKHIEEISWFITNLANELGKEKQEVDRYLMMHGKLIKANS